VGGMIGKDQVRQDAEMASTRQTRSIVAVIAASCAVALLDACSSRPDITPEAVVGDFEALARHVGENYAYFDQKETVWSNVLTVYRPRLRSIRTKQQLISLLERMLDELYDPHTHLTVNTPDSPPLVPSGTDIWAEWQAGKAIVVDVRVGSPAARAGVRPLSEITSIDGERVEQAIASRVGESLRVINDEVRSWALRAVLAGRRGAPRRLGLAGRSDIVRLEPLESSTDPAERVSQRMLADSIGYIAIHDALGSTDTIAQFDRALAEFRNTAGLVLDLRETPGGGNTTVARAILGRFVNHDAPYQRHVLTREERETGVRRSWLELVSPRGPFTYEQPVAVLVNHWTGSMGEGLALGFDATGAGTVVGTEMAGLLGATYHFQLPHSGFGVNIPSEQLTHVNGTPREAFKPPVYVSPRQLAGTDDDAILAAGVRSLAR
jgi:C-terminal processing protease CtpA/Prc